MIPIQGLFETHVTVRRLEMSVEFSRATLGLELAYLLPERRVAFFWLGDRGPGLLAVWEAGSAPNRLVGLEGDPGLRQPERRLPGWANPGARTGGGTGLSAR
jgi:hypothetical protein